MAGTRLNIILLAAIILVLWLMADTMTYTDEVRQAEYYTDMVCSGAWPDYRHTNPDCEE
jgi:predicted membrane-bound mannosyltransferase